MVRGALPVPIPARIRAKGPHRRSSGLRQHRGGGGTVQPRLEPGANERRCTAQQRDRDVPGDRLELKVEVLQLRSRFGKAKGEAFVEGQLATEAVFSFAVVDKDGAKG